MLYNSGEGENGLDSNSQYGHNSMPKRERPLHADDLSIMAIRIVAMKAARPG